MSPVSSWSGSNTPVQGAPTVPSMLPVAQESLASISAPMDTLIALRSRKALCAASLIQATDGSTAQEVRALRAQLKAAQLTDAHLRSKVETLEGQLKQLGALPAELAALKARVAQQEQAAAKGPSLEDVRNRLISLEDARPAIEPAQLASLHSEVQAMKSEANKLEHFTDSLRELEAAVKQQGKEVAGVSSNSRELKTKIDGLVSVKEDVKAIREQQSQGQALRGEAIQAIVQAAIQPEVARWEAMQHDQSETVQDLMTRIDASEKMLSDVAARVEASQKTSEELSTLIETDLHRWKAHSLSELKVLQDKISQVESDRAGTHRTTATLETDSRKLFDQYKDLSKNIKKYIGPIDEGHTNTDHTIIQRIGNLEAKSQSLQKEQDHHSDELVSISKTIRKCPVDSKDVKDLQETVRSLGEALELVGHTTTISTELHGKSQAVFPKHHSTSISEEYKTLSTRVTELEAASKKPASPIPSASHKGRSKSPGTGHVDTVASLTRIDGLEQRLRSVETHIGGTGGLNKRCDKLQSDIGKVENDVQNYKSNVDQVQQHLVTIFGEIFDPFKASVEGRFEECSRNLARTHEILADLQMEAEKSRTERPAAAFSASQLTSIRDTVKAATNEYYLSDLLESISKERERRCAAIEDLRQQMAGKQDVATAVQTIDGVKAAVRSLQSQYDNISTEDLHKKMVHWFTQNYPSPSANLLQQFAAVQHEVTQVRKFTDAVTRVPNSAQALSRLAQLSPHLIALAQSPLAANESRDTPAKTSELLKTVSDSVTKAQEQHDSLAKVVISLQASMHSLNSNKASFVKEESLAALEESIARSFTELKASIDQELQAREAIGTSVEDLTRKVEAGNGVSERALANSNEKLEDLKKGQIRTAGQVEELQEALGRLRSAVDQALDDMNDPKKKELFDCLPTLFSHVGQLQWVLEELSRRMPQGALEIKWHSDWKDLLSVPPPLTDGGDAVGKGKGRDKRQA